MKILQDIARFILEAVLWIAGGWAVIGMIIGICYLSILIVGDQILGLVLGMVSCGGVLITVLRRWF